MCKIELICRSGIKKIERKYALWKEQIVGTVILKMN